MKYEVKYPMRHGDRCPYCDQVLYSDGGGFECGGEGEGICSIWSAINDFGSDVARLPTYATIDVEAWIDTWILREVGVSWVEMGWDRNLHLRGVRETWNLPTGLTHAEGASAIVRGDYSHAAGATGSEVEQSERLRLSERVGDVWGSDARAQHDAFLSSLEAAVTAKKDSK